jgi:hypothetical protein
MFIWGNFIVIWQTAFRFTRKSSRERRKKHSVDFFSREERSIFLKKRNSPSTMSLNNDDLDDATFFAVGKKRKLPPEPPGREPKRPKPVGENCRS